MKLKPVCSSYWAATLFMVAYLFQPDLFATQPDPDYWQFANHQLVPVNQVTNVVPPVTPELTQAEPSQQDEKVWPLIIAAVIGVLVVGYIVYQIAKMAKKLIPPSEPPPPPPTNAPPYVIIDPGTGPGPALTGVHKMSLDTNQPSWGTIGYTAIDQLGYADKWGKSGVPFYAFWSCGLKTSTNLVDWEDSHYRIDAWISSGTFLAYYHYGTNYYNAYFTSSTNTRAYFDLTDHPFRPTQFFRLDPK